MNFFLKKGKNTTTLLKQATYNGIISSLLFLACVLGADQKRIFGQSEQLSGPAEFEIIGRSDRRVVIPFEVINNLIIINVSINGSAPLKLILDSGARSTLITGLPNGEELFLNNTQVVSLAGLGVGEPVEAFYSNKNNIKIGRVIGRNLEILFMKEDMFNLSLLMGTFVHGIIGHDLFANFTVEINYLSKEIFLYDPREFEDKFRKLPEHRKWYKFPIYVKDQKPYMDLSFKHKTGVSYTKLLLLLDTGSSNAFSLYSITHEAIKIPQSNIKTLIGVGLSGNVNGYLGRIREMKLGDFTFDEPVVAYPDSLSIHRAFAQGGRNGSMGGEVFRRFKTIFNYRDGYLLMRKNRNFNDDFYYNMSGIQINTPFPDLPIYVISSVRENSPAQKKGIEEGDIIRYINGKSTHSLTFSEMTSYFQRKRGSRIRLEVERDSVYKKISLDLENELYIDD